MSHWQLTLKNGKRKVGVYLIEERQNMSQMFLHSQTITSVHWEWVEEDKR